MRITKLTCSRSGLVLFVVTCLALGSAGPGLAAKGGNGGGGNGGGDPEPPADPAIVCVGNGLWKVNADGSNLTRILRRLQAYRPEPTWSPDTTQVALNAGFDGVGIYRVDADGSNLTMIAPLSTGYVSGPDWSPVPTVDGTYRIVFEDDGLNGPPGTGKRDLFLVTPDGASIVNLTNTADKSEVQAAWDPTATRIACKSGADFVIIHLGYANDTIVEVPPRTSLMNGVEGSPLQAMAMKGDPAWSPDGSAVAVWARPTTTYADPTDIWVIPVDDPADARNVTSTPGIHEGNPTWSEDGTEIAFRAWFPDGKDDGLYAVKLDGTGYRLITPGRDHPDWRSPQ